MASFGATGCVTTSHGTQPSALGTPSRTSELLAVIDQPGPIEVDTVVSTNWVVPLSGLLDLSDPQAKQAGLRDHDEPIQVYFHVLRHRTLGTYLIDTGVERALRDHPAQAAVRGLVAREMKLDHMDFNKPLGDWLAETGTRPAGVFFTHLHIDHIAGAPDLPRTTPIYVGPGETGAKAFLNLFVQGSVDRALSGLPPASEWRFAADPDHRFAGVIDVFGDKSLFAIYTPGHTAGSTAFIARTPRGPVLFTGDNAHTRWGWEHDVPPGTFTADPAANRKTPAALRQLVAEHPSIDVRLGHQPAH